MSHTQLYRIYPAEKCKSFNVDPQKGNPKPEICFTFKYEKQINTIGLKLSFLVIFVNYLVTFPLYYYYLSFLVILTKSKYIKMSYSGLESNAIKYMRQIKMLLKYKVSLYCLGHGPFSHVFEVLVIPGAKRIKKLQGKCQCEIH